MFFFKAGQQQIWILAPSINFKTTILYFSASQSPALARAIWHGQRLPVDTDPRIAFTHYTSFPFSILSFDNITPHMMGCILFSDDTHLNTDLWTVPEGNFKT